jgi:hypothetical protein
MKVQEEVEAFILLFLTSELYRDEWSALQAGHFILTEMVPITFEYPVMASTNAHMCAKISIHEADSYTFQPNIWPSSGI